MSDLIKRDDILKDLETLLPFVEGVWDSGYKYAVEEVIDLAKKYPSQTEWISCTERVPDNIQCVFAYNTALGYTVYAWYNDVWRVWHDNANDDIEYSADDISHWMPLKIDLPETD